jgi:RNA polymerase sigma-70 factor (ECF subfamily)
LASCLKIPEEGTPASVDRAAAAGSSEPTDAALLAKLRDGQVLAGEILVQRYYTPLIRYLHRLTSSEAVAEELLQQSWLSVLENVDRFDPAGGGGFKAWLFRIATNKANDYWRSRSREKNAKSGLRLVVDQEHPPADQRMEASEQELKLQWAISQLPDNQRQVLLLRYYSDLKFIEIAELIGCPLNTALGRMHKAMLKLKELMG